MLGKVFYQCGTQASFDETQQDFTDIYVKSPEYFATEIKTFVEDTLYRTKHYYFDKKDNEFKISQDRELEDLTISLFGDAPDIDECCVCYEKTKLKTNCKHTLCLPCWNQLKEDKCPMCRGELIYDYEDQ